MNTIIKASCPVCGEIEMTSKDVSLMVCSHPPLSYFAFNCPCCREYVRRPADEHVISLLLSGGVRATVWEIPAEALEPKLGPALTYDNLLDFSLALKDNKLLASQFKTS